MEALLRPLAYLYFLFVLRASAPLRPVLFPYLQWMEGLGRGHKEMSHTPECGAVKLLASADAGEYPVGWE